MSPVVIDVRTAEDTRDVIHRAVQMLVEGQLVAFPTETVYGIAASGRRADAVERLVAFKERTAKSPFALAIKSAEEASDFVPNMSPLAQRLARRCWPGPVTLVAECGHEEGLIRQLPEPVRRAVSPNGSVGLRVPANDILLDVLRMLAGPIVLTSANHRGQPAAVTADEVLAAVGDEVQLILDDGPCRYGQPSSVVRVEDNRLEVLREGVVAERTLRRLASVLVLLVCTGNTCRSPMAELLMRRRLARHFGCEPEELEERGVLVRSAGVSAAAGCGPSPEAVEVMREQGLDLSRHQSQPLTEQLVRHADLILTMTRGHWRAIVEEWPTAAERTSPLMPDDSDVPDPIGQSVAAYRHCAEQLQRGIEHHVDRIAQEVCGA